MLRPATGKKRASAPNPPGIPFDQAEQTPSNRPLLEALNPVYRDLRKTYRNCRHPEVTRISPYLSDRRLARADGHVPALAIKSIATRNKGVTEA